MSHLMFMCSWYVKDGMRAEEMEAAEMPGESSTSHSLVNEAFCIRIPKQDILPGISVLYS